MAETDPYSLDKVDREIRINELKEKAQELTGGQAFSAESEDAPPELLEAFWRTVVDIESGGWTSARLQLEEDGVALPPPEELDDEQVTAKLWEIIHRLAEHRTYFYQTNHLSDRELYETLWCDTLDEASPDMGELSTQGACVIDMVGSGSEEDVHLHMKYYADDEERRQWSEQYPADDMPPRTPPPYDRDRLLPDVPEGW